MHISYDFNFDSLVLHGGEYDDTTVEVVPFNNEGKVPVIEVRSTSFDGESDSVNAWEHVRSWNQLRNALSRWFTGKELEDAECVIIDTMKCVERLPGIEKAKKWRRHFFNPAWRMAHPLG